MKALTFEHSLIAKEERLPYIDLLETIAIYFVILYHTAFSSFEFLSDGTAQSYILYYSTTILSTCVPLFFFANGYLLFNKPFDLKKHIDKTLRMIVLVFVWAAILMPLYLLINGEPITIKGMLAPILTMSIDWKMNYFWYLGALVCIYIFFPALKMAFDHHIKAFVFFTVACSVFTFGLKLANEAFYVANVTVLRLNASSISSVPVISMFNPFRGIYGYSFVYFCGGGIMHAYVKKIREIPRRVRNMASILGIVICCGLLFLLGAFHSQHSAENWDVVWNGYDTVFTLGNTVFLFTLCLNYTGSLKFIGFVSRNTLGVYFLHGLFIFLLNKAFQGFDPLHSAAANVLFAFPILCACLAVIAALKKIPVVKRLL